MRALLIEDDATTSAKIAVIEVDPDRETAGAVF
jgi:hypothetical protein